VISPPIEFLKGSRDAHPDCGRRQVVRSDLRAIFEGRAGWEIVAEAKNGKEAIAKAIETQPDVAIIDYSLRLMNGIEVTCQIHAGIPKAEILVFTLHHSEELVRQLLEAGARGHLLKSDVKQYLIPAVETLADHKPFFAGRISQQPASLANQHGQPEAALSPRERVIVQLIAQGHSNKEMSEILSLSLKTIEGHRAAAMRKLNFRSTAALVRYAVRNRLVEP
jgi:DNA-binding NarL/FixJ family response regulator